MEPIKEQKINKTLFVISPEDISPNPYNPRVIFDEESMSELKKSIEKVGILVPLTVYLNTKKAPKEKYILLDGERRWRCAKELGLPTVPVNVIDEPQDVTQNILYMFNIHHYRKEWELFPTALKLDTIMKELGTDSEKQISEFTGVSRSMIRRCKMLLWMPTKYRNVLMNKSGKISTDFFIELYPIAYRLSQDPEYYSPQALESFIDHMIDIFLCGDSITDVKEFRQIRKAMGYYEKLNSFELFKKKLDEFLQHHQLDVFEDIDYSEERSAQNVRKYVGFLYEELSKMNTDYMSDYIFVSDLAKLNERISDILERID